MGTGVAGLHGDPAAKLVDKVARLEQDFVTTQLLRMVAKTVLALTRNKVSAKFGPVVWVCTIPMYNEDIILSIQRYFLATTEFRSASSPVM